MSLRRSGWVVAAALAGVGLGGWAPALSQEEGTRLLWDTGLIQKRPAAKKPAAAPSKPTQYRPVGAQPALGAASPASIADAILGITFWRLRRSGAGDDKDTRLLVLEEEGSAEAEFTPERIEADTPLANGERVRLTIEVPRSGSLYVIDREQYADGKQGPAYVIYPNWQTRQGDNSVAAGRLIEIPDQRDKPNHFRLRRSRPDQVAEVLMVMVTPQPLDLQISRRPLQISDEQLADWEKKYGVIAERFAELDGGAGKTWTAAEKAAGADSSQLLTRDQPPPQTLYRVRQKPGEPLMVKLPLKIGK